MSHQNLSTVDDVLRALNSLNKDELAIVNSKLRFLISTDGVISKQPASKVSTDDGDLMLTVICDFFRASGLEYSSPAMLRRVGGSAVFRAKVVQVTTYFEHGAGKLQRVEKVALFRIGVELLYKNLVKMGVAVSTRTVLSHIHRIPAVISESFPGYVQMGMLKIIINSKRTA